MLPAAERDVRSAVLFYRKEAGATVAARFIRAVEQRYVLVAANPAIGSPRFSEQLNVEGLRTTGVHAFPYLIFYAERAGTLEVWRVLHAKQNIPATLAHP